MTPLRTVTGRAVSLPEADVDTDIIYPARFLLITDKAGLGRYAFHDRRSQSGFPAAQLDDGETRVLVCGPNFGCGSSREQAVWALAGLGVRALVAPSFGEIFRANCGKNGVLAVTQPDAAMTRLHAAARAGERITVDLEHCRIEAAGAGALDFAIDADAREALLNGWDETTRIRALHADAIARFEASQRASQPWLWTADDAAARPSSSRQG